MKPKWNNGEIFKLRYAVSVQLCVVEYKLTEHDYMVLSTFLILKSLVSRLGALEITQGS